MPKTFADSIRAAIRAAPMTQAALARRLDVTEATISGLVNGKQWVGEDLMNRLARELGLTVVGRSRKAKG